MNRTIALAICAAASTALASDMKLYEGDQHEGERAWDIIKEIVFFSKRTWEGLYLGLYGVGSTIEKIDEDCFGTWIPEDMEFIYDYFHRMGNDFWSITYEDSTQLSYDIVDLIFLNDQYCHFRTSLYDIIRFCKSEEKPCAPSLVLQNL